MNDDRWVVLLRHAHAEFAAPEQTDHERPLSALGEAEAEAAGAFLGSMKSLPALQRVLCSSAERTRRTTERVLETLGYVDTRYEPRIYEASPSELLDVLEEHADVEVLMLVGHNPGMEHLVALLCSGRSGDFRGMPTGSMAVLRVPASAAIEPGSAKLDAFWSP